MSKEKYNDILDLNPLQKYDKPINVISGGSKYVDISEINSGRHQKKIKEQYRDIPFGTGYQSNQTQIQEYARRSKKMTGGMMPQSERENIKVRPRS